MAGLEGRTAYLAVNNANHGTIDYTVYDDAGNQTFTPAPTATYTTDLTSPNWVQGVTAEVGNPTETVSAAFQIVKRIIKVSLPTTIKNPATASNFKVGLLGNEPNDIKLIPVYPSGATIAERDKAFLPVLVNGSWWSPINVGQTKISEVGDPGVAGGSIFQWGRKQALKWDSPQKVGPVNSPEEAGEYFILPAGNWADWITPRYDKTWNSGSEEAPVKTESDPCPAGWRVPTQNELATMLGQEGPNGIWEGASSPGRESNGRATINGEFSTKLYFPATGGINEQGVDYDQGRIVYLWTSNNFREWATGWTAKLYGGQVGNGSWLRQRCYGLFVRCVQE